MRLYHISCSGCGWQAPLPVDARVAEGFRREKWCRNCRETYKQQVPYTIREVIKVGPVRYFPSRGSSE